MQRGGDSGLRVDHGTIVRRKGKMIGKLAESFCGLFSAVYGENGLGGACGVGGVFSGDIGVFRALMS